VGCGIIYTSTFLDDFWEYDPVSDSWTQRASFPAGPRYNTWQFVIDGIAYVGGGNSGGASGPFHADAFTYNPVTDTWAAGFPIPDQGRHGAVSFVINERGYVVCGRESDLDFVQDIWTFDPVTYIWSLSAPFPGAPRSSPLAFVYNNDAVVGCGRDASTNYFDAWLFDPASNTWSAITDYPGATAMAGASFSVGNRAFGGLGWELSTDLSHADLWELIKPGNVGMEELDSTSLLRVHPNPAGPDGFLLSPLFRGTMDVQLLEADGRLIDTWRVSGSLQISTQQLASGPYLLLWRTNDDQGTVKLIVP